MDQPSKTLPKLINLTEAARLLGYQSTVPIKKLISDNKLSPYKLPDTKRIMVDLLELESLLQVFIPENKKEAENSDT
tara:strand:- start:288 stop:518 length:231 start_codon:yes stop_codon:yes gene_type:complete